MHNTNSRFNTIFMDSLSQFNKIVLDLIYCIQRLKIYMILLKHFTKHLICTTHIRYISNIQIRSISTVQIRSNSMMEPLLATMKCFVNNRSMSELHQTHHSDASLISYLKGWWLLVTFLTILGEGAWWLKGPDTMVEPPLYTMKCFLHTRFTLEITPKTSDLSRSNKIRGIDVSLTSDLKNWW